MTDKALLQSLRVKGEPQNLSEHANGQSEADLLWTKNCGECCSSGSMSSSVWWGCMRWCAYPSLRRASVTVSIFFVHCKASAEEKTFQRGECWVRIWGVRMVLRMRREKLVVWHLRPGLSSDVCVWFCVSQCTNVWKQDLCRGKICRFSRATAVCRQHCCPIRP